MEPFSYLLRAQVLAIMAVNVGHKGIKVLSVPDMAHISHILIGISKLVGIHTDPGQKHLADVCAVYKSQNLCQFLQRKIRIQQIVDGFSNTHLVEEIEKGQAGSTGDIGADGRLTHEEDL